jgi:uncharacterized OsmC-like protein
MAALGGCIAMDVEAILRRSRTEPDRGQVLVRATARSDDVPGRPFSGFELIHDWETSAGPAALERAIRLAAERYCTVQLTVERSPEIVHRLAPVASSGE